MSNARMKHRRVVHKSTAGMLKSIPAAVGLVGNPSQGLTNNTVAPPLFDTGEGRGGGVCTAGQITSITDRPIWRRAADRETASLSDPLSQDLLAVQEKSLTSRRLSFSSLEQNIPGFSLMFVLLTLLFSVSLGLREEEVWGTGTRLAVAPMPMASLLGGKLLARWIIGTGQLLLLLLFGHFVYGLALGDSPAAMITVVTVVVASMTCFAAVVAAFVRTREQAVPVGLAMAFILASLGGLLWPLYNLPQSTQEVSRIGNNVVDVWYPGRDASWTEPCGSFN